MMTLNLPIPQRTPRSRGVRVLAVACFGLLVSAPLAPAQQLPVQSTEGRDVLTDARWRPWLGCWRPNDEVPFDATQASPVVLVCVSPGDGPAGIVIRTFADEQVILQDAVVADGERHPPRDPGCRGWQAVEWSSSGTRLFTSAQSTCAGEQLVSLSGFTTITPDDRWIDIQTVTANGRTGMRVRDYRRALGPLPAALADQVQPPRPRLGPMTFDEVKEASAKLSPFAVEAAIAETRVEFTASAKWVLALADAGVSQRVIDLIVALDFPDRFVITRARPGRPWTRAGLTISKIEPVAAAFAPFAYFWYGEEAWYDPGFIEYVPEPPGDGSTGGGRVSHGRLVKGFGYTQVEPRAGGTSRPHSGTSDSRSDGPADSSGSSKGSSDTASPQGYSSGGSGDGGRTAQPRPPG